GRDRAISLLLPGCFCPVREEQEGTTDQFRCHLPSKLRLLCIDLQRESHTNLVRRHQDSRRSPCTRLNRLHPPCNAYWTGLCRPTLMQEVPPIPIATASSTLRPKTASLPRLDQ